MLSLERFSPVTHGVSRGVILDFNGAYFEPKYVDMLLGTGSRVG